MKKVTLALIVVFLAAAVSWLFLFNGIGHYKSMVLAKQNSSSIAKLKSGITKKEVLRIMGPPNKIEVYAVGSRIFEFLLYRTGSFDILVKDKNTNFTPVAIDSSSGLVLSLDRKFYEQILNSGRK
jgi:hypothetical protein